MLDRFIEIFNKASKWLAQDSITVTFAGRLIKVLFIFFVIKISIKASYILIDKFFNKEQELKVRMEKRKAKTLSAIIKSLSKYIIYFIGLIIILDIFGVSTSSILATAGVGGLAIGFGAQSLVKDVITGFFILFEDYFSVGDHIQVSSYEGVVEELGIRSTRIRDFTGDLHIVPNGHIDIVTNRSRGDIRIWIDVRTAYKEDINKSLEALSQVSRNMSSHENISSGPTVLGVSDLSKDDVVLSIQAMVKPMEQWNVERAIRKEIKEEFERRQIAINDFRKIIIDKKEEKIGD